MDPMETGHFYLDLVDVWMANFVGYIGKTTISTHPRKTHKKQVFLK